MIHFLRRDGKTIVDCDAWKDDLRVTVCIYEYSKLLLDTEESKREEMMVDFDLIQELRAEYHEDPQQEETPDELAKRRVLGLAKKWNLAYITD